MALHDGKPLEFESFKFVLLFEFFVCNLLDFVKLHLQPGADVADDVVVVVLVGS